MEVGFRRRLLLVVLLGAGLRLATLTERGLWLDEATSLEVSSMSVARIAAGEAFDNHTPPFYYLLLHGWWAVAPKTELGLRLPSLLVDLANIALVGMVLGRLLGRRKGLTAALVYALSPYAVYFGQEGRMYSLTCCLGLVTVAVAAAVIERRDTAASWLLLPAVAVAGMYTHYFYAPLLLAVTVAVTVELRSDPKRLLGWWAAMAGVGLAFLPWLEVVLRLAGQGGQEFRRFTFLVLPYTLFRWSAGYAVFPLNSGTKDDWVASLLGHLPAVVAYLGVFGMFLVVGLRRLLEGHRRAAPLLLLPLGLPALLGLLASLWSPLLSERYLIVSFPWFVALLALALAEPAERLTGRLLQVAGAALLLAGLAAHFFNPAFGNAQWREAIDLVRASDPTARVLYTHPEWTREVVGFYAAPDVEVRPVSAPVLAGLLEPHPAGAVDPRPAALWLLEQASEPSILDELRAAGYTVAQHSLLPLRTGVRVVWLRHIGRSPTPEPAPLE